MGATRYRALKVQVQLKGVDQEACLQLINESGQRPENQITVGLVLRQKVESGEQVTAFFTFLQLCGTGLPTEDVGPSPGEFGH